MNTWSRKIFTTTALALILCLSMLVITGEAQAQRFVDNGNGTVTDTQTGLMWTQNANMFGGLNWHDAMSRCSSFSISGIGGWSLPSKVELEGLSHAMQGGHPFAGVQSTSYWSHTIFTDNLEGAWFVNMRSGFVYVDIMSSFRNVWCVRSGQ